MKKIEGFRIWLLTFRVSLYILYFSWKQWISFACFIAGVYIYHIIQVDLEMDYNYNQLVTILFTHWWRDSWNIQKGLLNQRVKVYFFI